jgi:hypothetical protein
MLGFASLQTTCVPLVSFTPAKKLQKASREAVSPAGDTGTGAHTHMQHQDTTPQECCCLLRVTGQQRLLEVSLAVDWIINNQPIQYTCIIIFNTTPSDDGTTGTHAVTRGLQLHGALGCISDSRLPRGWQPMKPSQSN